MANIINKINLSARFFGKASKAALWNISEDKEFARDTAYRYRPVSSHGYRGYRDLGEASCLSWIVLDRSKVDAMKASLIADFMAPEEAEAEAVYSVAQNEGFTCHGFHSGPGRSFAHSAGYTLGRNRVLVTRFSGLDI